MEELMRSSQIVAGGFLGDDPRPIEEIIEADAAEMEHLGVTREELADHMSAAESAALNGLGSFVKVGENLEAATDDNRGMLICPWGDDTRHFKTITTVRRTDTGRELRWSDLSIHLIREHGFFQGKGTAFRLEPRELVEVLMDR